VVDAVARRLGVYVYPQWLGEVGQAQARWNQYYHRVHYTKRPCCGTSSCLGVESHEFLNDVYVRGGVQVWNTGRKSELFFLCAIARDVTMIDVLEIWVKHVKSNLRTSYGTVALKCS
jgi:hypothetical protein